jgi:hypothetical protein
VVPRACCAGAQTKTPGMAALEKYYAADVGPLLATTVKYGVAGSVEPLAASVVLGHVSHGPRGGLPPELGALLSTAIVTAGSCEVVVPLLGGLAARGLGLSAVEVLGVEEGAAAYLQQHVPHVVTAARHEEAHGRTEALFDRSVVKGGVVVVGPVVGAALRHSSPAASEERWQASATGGSLLRSPFDTRWSPRKPRGPRLRRL